MTEAIIDTKSDGEANNEPQPSSLSRRAAKKAKRKQQKAEKKRQALDAYMMSSSTSSSKKDGSKEAQQSTTDNDAASTSSSLVVVGGKAARARLARQHDVNLIAVPSSKNHDAIDKTSSTSSSSWQQHRPQGGAPILSQVLPQHIELVEYLETKEQQMRIQGRGAIMKERMVVEVDCHGSMDYCSDDVVGDINNNNFTDDDKKKCGILSRRNLRGNFTLLSFTSSLAALQSKIISTNTILHLDLSRNELWNISKDALEPLASTLQTLDISRNWFESLPESIGTTLLALTELRATHNLLKPNALNVDALKGMNKLVLIDLRFNQKCGRQSLLDSLQSTLGTTVEIKLTVTYPPPSPSSDATTTTTTTTTSLLLLPSDKVGESPAVRDATLLRSQLEPWSTMALRRRLVADFGEKRTVDGRSWAEEDVSRGQVMERLLTMYKEEEASNKEGNNDHNNKKYHRDGNGRAVVNVSGTLVDESIRERVLHVLREFWTSKKSSGNRERPSIAAENYMILCSPTMFDATSQNAAKAAIKLKKHETLWNLAHEAIHSVDPIFASQYTAVAVTHNFEGSPHIDKQNTGPFYGFAVGDYEDGTGGIMVECSARVIAKVNTKNRMAKVDGRYPHWVGPYDSTRDRFSLIYYKTDGEVEPIGPAVFTVPSEICITCATG